MRHLLHCLAMTILVCPALGQEKGRDATPGPVSSWRFEESGFTGGVVEDHHGELDVRLTKGGLEFTGSDDQQAVLLREDGRALVVARDVDPASRLPSNAFSVAAWVRLDAPNKWSGILSAVQDNGEYERGWVTGINGDRFYFGVAGSDGNGITYIHSSRPAEPGRWHHLVATYDGRRMRLHVDGRLDTESLAQRGGVNWPPRTTIALGCYIDDDERHPLVGALHSIELHDRALDAAEVARLFNERAGAFPEPVVPEHAIASRTPETISGWPMYRRDPQRSAATDEVLPGNLIEAWRIEVAPPRPSWPEPAQRSFWQNIDDAVPRVVFDLAHHPVSDGRVAVFASARDDHVRCLDLETGALRWRVATDGPIRFAPVLHDGGVFVASDDGYLHRFDLETGASDWSVQLAPENRRIPGNGRLISTWPIRTGPVIDRGVLHATSGLFPRFGTRAHAIDPDTGEVIWSRLLPGTSPQGYLLASSSRLFIPTGRTAPTTLDREDGRNLGTFDLPGGTFAILVEDQLVSGPGSTGTLVSAHARTRETAASFQADRGIVVPELVVLQRGDTLLAIDRPKLLELETARAGAKRRLAELEALVKNGQRDAAEELRDTRRMLATLGERILECELWRIEHPAHCLAMAGDSVIAAGDGTVSMLDARSGETTWSQPIKGRGHGLAIAGQTLLVSTSAGALHAFRAGPPAEGLERASTHGRTPTTARPELLELLRREGMDRGIAVVIDPVDGGDAFMLAEKTNLHVVVLDDDQSRIDAIRTEAVDRLLYGDRLVAHAWDPAGSGIVDGVANLLVSERGLQGDGFDCGPGALDLVRPNGGLVVLGAPWETVPEAFEPIAGAPLGAYRRQPLSGAGDWTHPYADAGNSTASDDTLVDTDTALQWFGGPGPARMVDRHLRTTSSLAHGGRLFVPGNDVIIGVDAYNGTELWETRIPGFTRTGAPYDGGWWAISEDGLFAAAGDGALRIDPRNGLVLDRHALPVPARLEASSEWGWLAVTDDLLLGSTAIAGASRRAQSRNAVVEQYEEFRPLVTSRVIFAVDPVDGALQWQYRGGPIPNATIATNGEQVFFVESRNHDAVGSPPGRIALDVLGEQGLDLVSIDLASGREVWRVPVNGERYAHSLYLGLGADTVVLTGCTNTESQNLYHVSAHDSADGRERWHAVHPNNRNGIGGDHGEQVHHPVILEQLVIAEPLAYDLVTGEVVDPTDTNGFSIRSRSGCGTMSASATCLFFRDGNPTAIRLGKGGGEWTKLTHASRPGCWVNLIPAQGLILMPESSAGCVCGFSLQTSMALVPVRPEQ